MVLIGRLKRWWWKTTFHKRDRVTIKDIPTGQWQALIARQTGLGWRESERYDGIDAGIDYDRVKLKKDGEMIRFEWDNWTEGSLDCSGAVAFELEAHLGKSATKAWRWLEYEPAPPAP